MRHLSTEAIVAYLDSDRPVDQASPVVRHLGSCGECRERATELRALVEFLSEDRQNEPPADVLGWAVGLFQPAFAPARPGVGRRALQIAKRVFDSYEQALEGVRTMGTLPRQLLYRAGDVDVDLKLEAVAEGRISLEGQVLSGSERFPDPVRVYLESGGAVRRSTSTNAVGEFSFAEVPEDTYHLSMDLPEGELRIFCVNRESAVR